MSGLINAHDFTPTVVSVSGSLLMDTYYVCTAAGTTTQTLPATSGSGKVIIIENLGAGTITLSRTGSDTINGVTSLTLAPYGVIKIRDYAVGTWYIQTGNVAAYFPNASTTPGLLNYYQEDDTTCAANTFSGSAGGAASGVCALKIRRVGSLVSVVVPAMVSIVPTSNSDHLVSSIAVPSWARPTSASYTSITVSNNGAAVTTVLGIVGMQPSGLIYVFRDSNGTNFTDSQNAGWRQQYILTYPYGV